MKHTHGFFLHKVFYPCPKNFEELNAKQLVAVHEVLAAPNTHEEAIAQLLPVLFAVEKSLRLRWFFLHQMSAFDLYDLAIFCEPFIEQEPTTQNLVPSISCQGSRLFGPADALENLCFIEFIKAEHFFVAYAQQQQPQDLQSLVAVLYRPAKRWFKSWDKTADRREPYNDHTLEARAKALATIPWGLQMAILNYYVACRNALIAQFPRVFVRPEDQISDAPNFGWVGVWLKLSGTKFGDDEQTANKNIYLILADLEIMMTEKAYRKSHES
jgi:hypothetical protein